MVWGLQPGPLLFVEQKDFVWGLIASMYLSNIAGLIIVLTHRAAVRGDPAHPVLDHRADHHRGLRDRRLHRAQRHARHLVHAAVRRRRLRAEEARLPARAAGAVAGARRPRGSRVPPGDDGLQGRPGDLLVELAGRHASPRWRWRCCSGRCSPLPGASSVPRPRVAALPDRRRSVENQEEISPRPSDGAVCLRPEADHGIAGLAAEERALTLRDFAIPPFAWLAALPDTLPFASPVASFLPARCALRSWFTHLWRCHHRAATGVRLLSASHCAFWRCGFSGGHCAARRSASGRAGAGTPV